MRRAGGIVVLLLAAAGCQFKGEPAPDASPASPPPSDAPHRTDHWQPQPAAIRVYPTTRFVRQGGSAVLEARIELFDEMGDSVKGSGEYRLELHTNGGASPAGDLLYSWRVELRTVEDHRRHYDPVTRGYLFRLRLDDLAVARRSTRLTVVYTTPTGQRHAAEAPIRTDW